jgi:hypothetical protein
MNHPLCLHSEITHNSLDRSAACAARNSKGNFICPHRLQQFAVSGLNWTPVHWFTEFVDLSLAQDLVWSFRDGPLATSASIAAAEQAVDPAAVRKT